MSKETKAENLHASPAVLHLTITKKWYDLILSGEKKEEYRERKPYWGKRFSSHWCITVKNRCEPPFKKFDYVEFKNGYARNAPTMLVECKGIKIGRPRYEWSDGSAVDCFIISLGNVVASSALKAT